MADRLERFRTAHQSDFKTALNEIRSGHKKSHWMWYIFPQVAGLAQSSTSRFYAIENLDEAKAFLDDDTLGKNLIEISQALLELESNDAREVMGYPDDIKLRSSMTLFTLAKPDCGIFQQVLDKFFSGDRDKITIELLKL